MGVAGGCCRGRSIVNTQPVPGISRTLMSPAFTPTAVSASESPRPSSE